ncbi:alpha,alpha-trehalose-phosphate synthase [Actinokineospora sp. NBRC 105648]|nr:alpha,alpha-trehalose-phosphate synthase [Actinokineospora sp. NBRC 105648]
MTDLDGTLLAGTAAERAQLRDALTDSGVVVVLATGRGRASVAEVLRDPLVPRADWVICDVGSTVCHGDLRVDHSLQGHLRRGWPGAAAIRAALEPFDLVYQEGVPQEGRCSYLADVVPPGLAEEAARLGCHVLHSGGWYLDILPRGVDKGAAVAELARREGWHLADVLVAGDSLNDLSMLRLETESVVVGGAEPALAAELGVEPAGSLGAVAILAALRRLGWVDQRHRLVVGYHRSPVLAHDGGWRPPSSPNGILPTLTSVFSQGLGGVWVTAAVPEPAAADHGTGLPLEFLSLSRARWAGFLNRTGKETLWPLLVSRPDLTRFDPDWWSDYREINRRFAEHIDAMSRPGATVWLHDYNLWLVPGFLQAHRPDLRVGLFHHTPFPEPALFDALPTAGEVRSSLAGLDWAGFHTAEFAHNFRAAIGPGPRLGVHPLGVDRTSIERLAVPAGPQPHRVILAVERLDYTKAPALKVRAVGDLLRERPDLRGTIVFRLVCPPPEPGITAYDETRRHLESMVREVNAAWSTPDWSPVDYRPTCLPFDEIIAQYAAADTFWVASLHDGMNLTAQEFIATQHAVGGTGALILSRRAGAASVFTAGPVFVDPSSAADMLHALHTALALTTTERAARLSTLAETLGHATPMDWATHIRDEISGRGALPHADAATQSCLLSGTQPSRPRSLNPAR